MGAEQLGKPDDLSNEQLFWAAYEGNFDLFEIGGTLDERIDSITGELHQHVLDTGNCAPDKELERMALVDARDRVDLSYFNKTGGKRRVW